jgi:hypothetical protein
VAVERQRHLARRLRRYRRMHRRGTAQRGTRAQ